MMELHDMSSKVVKLVLKPYHMDFHICMSQWMVGFTKGTNESQNKINVTN